MAKQVRRNDIDNIIVYLNMDTLTIKKYFNLDDEVVITGKHGVSVGRIVDFSDTVLVLEDNVGNPIIISLENITSCKKANETITSIENQEYGERNVSDLQEVITDIIASFDEIYSQFSISNDKMILTNAVVTGMSSDGVEVLTDTGEKVVCVKSSFVGYSRENAAVGKRVFCSPNKEMISYASLTEMSYGEMYERFLRAINTKPKPRTSILSSVLVLLAKEYGNPIISRKKAIKKLIKKLNAIVTSTTSPFESTNSSKRIKLEELTKEQIHKIYELLGNSVSTMADLPTNEQIKYADNAILENCGIKIRRIAVKTILSDIFGGNAKLTDDTGIYTENTSQVTNEEKYISATCEIKKYYPQYHNGLASDNKNTEIRFKDDVIVDESLGEELKKFQWWVESYQPIPVVCVYKKVGKWQTASFVTKPGTLMEFRNRISRLMDSGKKDLADALQKYLDSIGYFDDRKIQFTEETPSPELLLTTRRKRLIKNFKEAEIGFLEIIRREYELDAAVRDLAMMYQEWGKSKDAIQLLEDFLPRLNDKMKVYNMLYIFYHSAGFDSKAVHILEKALDLLEGDDKQTKYKREKILKKIANVKKKKNKSNNQRFTTFAIDDIPLPLLRYDANNTNSEVLSYITTESFDKKWQFVNKRIDELRNTPDVPAYYLAKIQLLEERGESGNSIPVRMALADYCKARARNFYNDGNESSARAYLLQGISVIDREDIFFLLLISLCAPCSVVLSKYNEPVSSYDDIVNEFSIREEDEVFCVLLQIINKDTPMSRKLIRFLYECDASAWLSDELDLENPTPQQFIEALNNFSTKQSDKLKAFEDIAGNILLESDSSVFGKKILEIPFFSSKEMLNVETKSLSSLREIADLIIDSEKKNFTYEDCDDICQNVFSKADVAIAEIEKAPSHYSTISILPLLIKARDMMEYNWNRKYTESLPQISVNSIDDAHPIGDDIEIQITISNEMGCSRVNNGIFTINSINEKDVTLQSLNYVLETPLLGGNKVNVAFSLKSSLFSSDNIDIEYTFTYLDVRKISHTKHDKISLVINKGDDYEDFDNPYIAHVKSNAVKDKSMFKGRDEIIETICKYVLEDYKGYVLYGQKRSGKSSVLYHITQRLRAEHKAFAVDYTMGSSIVQDSESEKESVANLFYTIISEIGRAIKEDGEDGRRVYRECNCHIVRRREFEDYPDQTFKEYLDYYRDIIVDKLHYEQDKIVLVVDEFTYLYYHILEGKMSPGIMEFWKGLVESRIFSFVFAGQDAMPRFMDDFQNVFVSMHPQELTYIDEKSARELIEEPIWNKKKDCSRFHPDAVDEIIKLTACSPFYIMILCSELVKFARQRKRLPIQVSDVSALVQKMICNESSISRKDFDNLISCGESRLDVIDKDDSLKVLKDIAVKSRNMDYYDYNAINVFDKEKVKAIIADLLRRGVLEPHADFSNKVKIKVELFKRWLLNHE